MYTMGSTTGYCITVHMKEYSSAGALWTIPWALLHHGMHGHIAVCRYTMDSIVLWDMLGWNNSMQVYHGQYHGISDLERYSIDQGGASWESYHPSGQSQAILDMCAGFHCTLMYSGLF